MKEIFPLPPVPFKAPVTVPLAKIKEEPVPSVMLVAAMLFEPAVIELLDPIVKAARELPEDPRFPIRVIVKLLPILTVPTASAEPCTVPKTELPSVKVDPDASEMVLALIV